MTTIQRLSSLADRAQAGLTGLLGERLPRSLRHPEGLELRLRGEVVTPRALARHLGTVGRGREVVFFLHGLMLDESCWTIPRFDMTKAFELAFDVVAVHVRYDTSRHISTNGEAFAGLLEAVHVELGEERMPWHLVCHSMGGLVARSALARGRRAEMQFTSNVDKVLFLATPHRGAPLEKGVQLAQVIMRVLPAVLLWNTGKLRRLLAAVPLGERWTLAPIGQLAHLAAGRAPELALRVVDQLLDLRSDGIRDLRHGAILSEQWHREDSWGLKRVEVPVPPCPNVRWYAVAGTIANQPTESPSWHRTDGMVSTASAANLGPADDLAFLEHGRYSELSGMNHFIMTSDPRVFEVLARWFAEV